MSDTERRDPVRVPLARLWGRTSKAGTPYLVGRLGQARLLAFPGTDAEGTAVLDLVLVPGEPRERQTPAQALARESGPPSEARQRVLQRAAHSRSAFAAPPPADAPERARPAADDDIPF